MIFQAGQDLCSPVRSDNDVDLMHAVGLPATVAGLGSCLPLQNQFDVSPKQTR